jgi:1-acyl-sn-glycerol-3-phosphate acyltransferase
MAQTPIIPITIDGAYDILPRGCKFLHWSPVTLTFHAPIECNGRDSESVDRIMNEAERAIAETLYKNK